MAMRKTVTSGRKRCPLPASTLGIVLFFAIFLSSLGGQAQGLGDDGADTGFLGDSIPTSFEDLNLPPWFKWIVITDGTLLVLFVVTILMLRIQVRRRTGELSLARRRLERQNEALADLARIQPSGGDDFIPSLRQITEIAVRTLNTDRASVWLYSYDRSTVRCVELYDRTMDEHTDGVELTREQFPVFFEVLDGDEGGIPAEDVYADPRTKQLAESYLRGLNIEALLVTPIRITSGIAGVFVSAYKGTTHKWLYDERNFANTLGDTVALVLESLDHRRAEQQLRRSERHFRALIENARDVIAIFDRSGSAQYFSPSVERLMGYKPEELIGRRGYDLVHPEDLKAMRERMTEVSKHPGIATPMTFRFMRKDGSWRQLEAMANNLADDPAVKGLVMNLSDVTERNRAIEEVSRRQEYFRSLIENALDVIVILEMAGDEALFRYASPSTQRVLGYDPQEIVGKSSLGVIDSDDLLYILDRFKEGAEESELVEPFECRIYHADGSLMYMDTMMSRLVEEKDVRGIVLNLRDVTGRRKAEKALRDARRRLRTQNSALAELARLELPLDGDLGIALRTVSEMATLTLETSRSSIWRRKEGDDNFECLDQFDLAVTEHQWGMVVSGKDFYGQIGLTDHERIIAIDNILTDERTARLAEAHLLPDGVASILNTPIRVGGQVVGVICHEHMGDPRVWQPDEQNFAAALADTIALFTESVERMQAQRSLSESEARARTVLDSAVEGVITFDTKGIIESVNPAAQGLFGYDGDALLGETMDVLMPEPFRSEHEASLKEYLLTNDKGVFAKGREALGLRKDGSTFPIWISVSEVRVGNVHLLTSFVHDITERKRAQKLLEEYSHTLEKEVAERTQQLEEKNKAVEDALKRLQDTQNQLILAEKMASLGQLTAGIAHEIKNPLNFINNFAEISIDLVEELEELARRNDHLFDEESRAQFKETFAYLKQNASKINDHGKRADTIVRGMLLHSRGTAGEAQATDINTLLDEYIKLAYHGLRARDATFAISIKTDYDPHVGKLNVIPQSLSRVFLNIVNNACYAAHERKLAENGNFSPTLWATTKDLEDGVEIRIRDNGRGIPPENRDKIFNPFFTTKPSGQGTGLGLSMSYDIVVQEHQGKLTVDSKPGEYTEFRIFLPKQP